jgi:hypothetical protein
MTTSSLRLLIATALAVAAIAVSASGVLASGDLAACTLQAKQGDAPDNVGAVLETAVAPSANDVWVLGSHVSGPGSSPSAQHWDGAGWTKVELDLPAKGISVSSIYDARAFSPDDIWAVGSWQGELPIVQHWDGKVWSSVRAPKLQGGEQILTGIDGTGPDDMWVVGQRLVANQEQGLVLHYDGKNWSVVPAPPEAAALHDVAMIGSEPTVVGWSIGAAGFAQGLIATYADPTWQVADITNDPHQNLFMFGIASATPGGAWAVGFSNDSPNRDTARAFQRTAGAWQEVPVPDIIGSDRLVAVATDAEGTVAVGHVLFNGINRDLVLRATGTGWEEMPGSGEGAPDTLSGVTLQEGTVWAVGRGVVTGATYGVPSARIYTCA